MSLQQWSKESSVDKQEWMQSDFCIMTQSCVTEESSRKQIRIDEGLALFKQNSKIIIRNHSQRDHQITEIFLPYPLSRCIPILLSVCYHLPNILWIRKLQCFSSTPISNLYFSDRHSKSLIHSPHFTFPISSFIMQQKSSLA